MYFWKLVKLIFWKRAETIAFSDILDMMQVNLGYQYDTL